jgi:Rap guanine nucleotide exchange factor 2
MVFAVVEKAGTVVMNDHEELDSWSVIINGEVRVDHTFSNNAAATGKKDPSHQSQELSRAGEYRFSGGPEHSVKILRWGDSFGITPTMEKLYHVGVMKTCQDDCQFVCITQTDYYKILNEGESNQRRYEEDGKTVLVTEPESSGKVGHKVIRGTPERLLSQLIDENSTEDLIYVEDFLLTQRKFMKTPLTVAEKLLEWFHEGKHCDR